MISKRKLLIVLIALSGVCLLHGQQEGDIWVMGYNTSAAIESDFGLAYWHFNNDQPLITYDLEILASLEETNASIASVDSVLFMTNGMEVFLPSGKRIIDTIAFLDGGDNWKAYYSNMREIARGFPKMQTAIILPIPDHVDEYSIIHYHGLLHSGLLFYGVAAILETRIRRTLEGSWEVIFQDKPILKKYDNPFHLENDEFLSQGTWHVNRHANGRDWWMLMHDFQGDKYYRLLLSPSGLRNVGEQTHDEMLNLAQNAWFSPDGRKYIKYVNVTVEQSVLYIYDFDRCTGLLDNRVQIEISGEELAFQGMCFSPNSRYLFAGTNHSELHQYDLLAGDIQASRTLVDINDGYIEPNWFNTTFGPMMPGPDGRIYMFPTSGSSRAVHVIDRPNEHGKAAKLLQHHIMLQTSNARSVQNFANFRLGPLDDSPCDTLGLDNHPQSRWRYETEDVDPLEIRFTDLSFFRPEIWHWDFGDGKTSSEVHPIHTYASPGLYYACLTVSNEYSSDTSCQWIEIESVSTEDTDRDEVFIVHPNPFTDYIEITPPGKDFNYHVLKVTIVDIHGRVIASPEMTCPCRLKLGSIPDGMYFYTLELEGKKVGSGKILKSGNR